MKLGFFFLLFLLSKFLCLNLIKPEISEEEFFPKIKETLILSDLTIERAISLNEKILIIFFAPWCEHCKKFIPLFHKFSKEKNKIYNLTLGQINADYYINSRNKFKIKGYPTILLFSNFGKEIINYNAGLTYENLDEYFYRNFISPIHHLNSIKEANELEKKDGINFIYFGNNSNDLNVILNKTKEDYFHNFYQTTEKKVYEKFNITKERTLLLLKLTDERFDYLKEDNITESNINLLIKLNEFPYILKVPDAIDHMAYFRESVVFVVKNNKINFENFIYSQAKLFRGKLRFTFLEEEKDSQLIEYINYPNSSKVKISIIDFKQGDENKIYYEDDFYKEKINDFFNDFINDKFRLPLKSEEIPTTQNNVIYKLVRDNFYQEVIDNKKDIFVKFYSPYCPHCTKLAPIYEELGKKFYKIKDYIRIAEFNIAENDFDYFQIKGYPTLIFWRGGNKYEHIEYIGDRNLDDMINFIVKNSNYYLNYNGNEVSMDNETMKIMNEKKIDNLNNINKTEDKNKHLFKGNNINDKNKNHEKI